MRIFVWSLSGKEWYGSDAAFFAAWEERRRMREIRKTTFANGLSLYMCFFNPAILQQPKG